MNIETIPPERLAMLDTALLSHGSHGGPDCLHCARELAYEIVTGEHRDENPPGCTLLFEVMPRLNDGPWRDDKHRTEVLRPYIKRMLVLDPKDDERRIYAVIDHVYRKVLPDVCDALKLDKHGTALRDLAPIVDRRSARAALAARNALAGRNAIAALATINALDAALATINALDAALAAALAALAARNALNAALNAALAASWERGCCEVLEVICGE